MLGFFIILGWVVLIVIVVLAELVLGRKRGELSDYACVTCGEPIRGKVYELVKVHESDPILGGTVTFATYCADHAPGGCRVL